VTRDDHAMGRVRAGAGSLAFLLFAPGVVAGLIPWLLTDWEAETWWTPLRLLGGLMIGAGLAVLLEAFARFALEGIGTPAPVAPTERLVAGGTYRYVRNPMYLAVGALIVGQALVLGQAGLLVYAAAFGAAVAAFVHGYEEPVLAQRFGPEYEGYRRAVPAWWPRLTPWEPDSRYDRTRGG
jgi:protein-S-isoprenylcysteine O-methyltransferase Ste14